MRKRIMLKRVLKNKITILVTVIMIIVCFLMNMNQKEKEAVVIYTDDEKFGNYLYSEIYDSVFEYYFVNDSSDVIENVTKGKAKYGIVMNDNYDKLIAENKLNASIEFYSTPSSLLSEVVKEEIFSYWIAYYSDSINAKYVDMAFKYADSDEISSLKNKYLDSNQLFDVNIIADEYQKISIQYNNMVRGIIGLCVFCIIYLANWCFYNADEAKVYKSMAEKEAVLYRISNLIMAGIPVICAGEIFIIITNNYDILFVELIKVFSLIVFSIIWCLFISKIVLSEETYIAIMPAMIIVQLFVCPVIINIDNYINFFRYIKYLFPLGVFL